MKQTLCCIIGVVSMVLAFALPAFAQGPSVVSTVPANGATDVDPALGELSVTFSSEMEDGSWSWCMSDQGVFPSLAGDPSYTPDMRTNVLPVELQPGTTYVMWIKCDNFMNFRDTQGNPATPMRYSFTTRSQ